jgi:hypothetical protein
MKIERNALQLHLLEHFRRASTDERNDEHGADFWQRVAVMVEAGKHPHRNVLARGIARYGVPALEAVTLYVAMRVAGAKRPPKGNPGGPRSKNRPTDAQLRREHRDELPRLQALKRDQPLEFYRIGPEKPSEAAIQVIASRYALSHAVTKRAIYPPRNGRN